MEKDKIWTAEDFSEEIVDQNQEQQVDAQVGQGEGELADKQEPENQEEVVRDSWTFKDFAEEEGEDTDETVGEVSQEEGAEEVVAETDDKPTDDAEEAIEPQTEEEGGPLWKGEVTFLKMPQEFEVRDEEHMKEIIGIYLNYPRLNTRLQKYEELSEKLHSMGIGDKQLDDFGKLLSGKAPADLIAKYMKHNKIDYISDDDIEKAGEVSVQENTTPAFGENATKVINAYQRSLGAQKTQECMYDIGFFADSGVIPEDIVPLIRNGDAINDGSGTTYTAFFLGESASGALTKVLPKLYHQLRDNPNLRAEAELNPVKFVELYRTVKRALSEVDINKPVESKTQNVGGKPSPKNGAEKIKSMKASAARVSGAVPTKKMDTMSEEERVLQSGDISAIKEFYKKNNKQLRWAN